MDIRSSPHHKIAKRNLCVMRPCFCRILGTCILLFLNLVRCSAQTSAVTGIKAQGIDERNLVALPGNVYPFARSGFDQGPLRDSQPLSRILLVLQRSAAQETALQQLLSEQQDKASPDYHAWLTSQEYGQRFGVVDADLQIITQWLMS